MTTQTATIQTATGVYEIDAARSRAEFAVKLMTLFTVRGSFRDIEGAIYIDEDAPERSWVEATVRTASIDTGNRKRDKHLRSDDFFRVEAYPAMTFRSTSVERLGNGRWLVLGDLTVRDITRPVALDTVLDKRAENPSGRARIGFRATTSLKRRDYGVALNPVLEAGGLVIGKAAKVTLNIQAVRKD